MRPGLDRPVALGRLVDQQAAGLIEGDAVADEGIGNRRIEPELPRRVVDAGDAGPLLGDHPPGDVLGAGRRIGGAVGARNDVRLAPDDRFGRRGHGGVGILSDHGILVGCVRAVGVADFGAAGVG